MADFDIKPASGTGNSLRLKNEAGNIVLSTNNGTGVSSWGTVAPKGTILQVKQVFKDDAWEHQGTTAMQNVTGMTLDITPKATTNKILVTLSLFLGCETGNLGTVKLVRTIGGSATTLGKTTISGNGGTNEAIVSFGGNDWANSSVNRQTQGETVNYLDSPSTTSATTYKIQIASGASDCEVHLNRWALNSDKSGTSSITLMEVAE